MYTEVRIRHAPSASAGAHAPSSQAPAEPTSRRPEGDRQADPVQPEAPTPALGVFVAEGLSPGPSDGSRLSGRGGSFETFGTLGSAHGSFAMMQQQRRHRQDPSVPLPAGRGGPASAGRAILMHGGLSSKARGSEASSATASRRGSEEPLLAKYNSDDDIGVRIAAFRLDHLVSRLAPQGKFLVARGVTVAPVATDCPDGALQGGSGPRAGLSAMEQAASTGKGALRRRSIANFGTHVQNPTYRKRRLSWDPSVDRAAASKLAGIPEHGGSGESGGRPPIAQGGLASGSKGHADASPGQPGGDASLIHVRDLSHGSKGASSFG